MKNSIGSILAVSAFKTFLMVSAVGVYCAVLMVAHGQSAADLVPTAKRMQHLQGRLHAVREEMRTLHKRIQEENARFTHYRQHDAVYTNSPAAALYKEIVALEKRLAAKREKLEVETRKMPELAKMRKERKALYDQMRKLRDRELLIRREIRTEQIRLGDSALGKKPGSAEAGPSPAEKGAAP